MWAPLTALVLTACQGGGPEGEREAGADAVGARADTAAAGGEEATRAVAIGRDPILPEPQPESAAAEFPDVQGWTEGASPTASDGFEATLFAEGLDHPRWLYVLPNGDVLVAESNTERLEGVPEQVAAEIREAGLMGPSADRITLLRDEDGDGTPEVREVFLDGLNQPFGMVLVGNDLYVANTDALMRFPYQEGQTRIDAPGEKVLDLPAGGYNNHWTRNVVASPDGSKLYVSVGSATNVDEEGIDAQEPRRAAILEVNPDGSGARIYASGLRNPNGMDWHPETGELWTVVNERDGLGDDLVPDYLTRVREGAFYGWPWVYWGSHPDPRKPNPPDTLATAVEPDYALGGHVAALGLVFSDVTAFPERFRNGAFVARHGSWNRSQPAGYDVVFVAFEGGNPTGMPEAILTGFVADPAGPTVYGRPVGLALTRDGALLVADDAGNRVWRVAAAGAAATGAGDTTAATGGGATGAGGGAAPDTAGAPVDPAVPGTDGDTGAAGTTRGAAN